MTTPQSNNKHGEFLSRWRLPAFTEEGELLTAKKIVSDTLGVDVDNFAPAYVGTRSVSNHLRQNKPSLIKPIDWSLHPELEQLNIKTIRYYRKPPEIRPDDYFVLLDKNHMFLGPLWKPLPVGGYIRMQSATDGIRTPWFAQYIDPLDFYGWYTSPTFMPRPYWQQSLVTSGSPPSRVFCAENGYPLVHFAKRILSLLESTIPSVPKMAKAIYVQTIGFFKCKEIAGKSLISQWFYRPDWRNIIIAEANIRMLCNIRKLYETLTVQPTLIYADEIGYLASDPDKIDAHLPGSIRIKAIVKPEQIKWGSPEEIIRTANLNNLIPVHRRR